MQHALQNPFVKGKPKQSKEIKFMKNRNIPACNAAPAETLRVCDAGAVALRARIFTTTLLVLYCFALSPVAQARRPSEDRGNGNSAAENVDALNLGTTGANNTAHGWFSLFSYTTGSSNTADGFPSAR